MLVESALASCTKLCVSHWAAVAQFKVCNRRDCRAPADIFPREPWVGSNFTVDVTATSPSRRSACLWEVASLSEGTLLQTVTIGMRVCRSLLQETLDFSKAGTSCCRWVAAIQNSQVAKAREFYTNARQRQNQLLQTVSTTAASRARIGQLAAAVVFISFSPKKMAGCARAGRVECLGAFRLGGWRSLMWGCSLAGPSLR